MAHRQHCRAQRHSQDARLAGRQFVERRQTLCNAFPAIDPAHFCRGDRPWWPASLVESSLGSETALWICGLLLAPAGGTEFLPNQSPGITPCAWARAFTISIHDTKRHLQIEMAVVPRGCCRAVLGAALLFCFVCPNAGDRESTL